MSDALDDLPTMQKLECVDCGSKDWSASNINEHGEFHQCNLCHEYDVMTDTLIKKTRH